MNVGKLGIAAVVGSALTISVVQQANATIYGGARLQISDLTVVVLNATGFSLGNWNLTNTSTASLAGNVPPNGLNIDTCSGTGVGQGTCNALPPGPRLGNTLVTLGAPARVATSYSFFNPGPGNAIGDYASSNAQIGTAEITGDGVTNTINIAEAELQSSSGASSSSQIQSTSAFVFNFSIMTPGDVQLRFMADPDLLAFIDAPMNGSTQASVASSFTLQQTSGGTGFAQWAPDGNFVVNTQGNCNVGGGLTCTEIADTESLNVIANTGASGTAVAVSDNRTGGSPDLGLVAFGIDIMGLTAGDYSFGFQENKQVQLTQVLVPEPEMLLLLGTGLLGFGLARGRRRRQTV